ncbi:MAG: hypothetical protein ACK5LC_09285, partial [Coprobacillaceae bacterium]
IQILHVGRLKKEIMYASFSSFLNKIMRQEVKKIISIIKYTILSSILMTCIFIGLMILQENNWLLYGSGIFILWNLQHFIQYLLKRRLLSFSQFLIRKYGYEKLLDVLPNKKVMTDYHQVIEFIEEIGYWIQLFCSDLVIEITCCILLIFGYGYSGFCMIILIIVFEILYFNNKQNIVYKYEETSKHGNYYLQNQRFLYQFQYQDMYQYALNLSFKEDEKQYHKYKTNQFRKQWFIYSVIVIFIVMLVGVAFITTIQKNNYRTKHGSWIYNVVLSEYNNKYINKNKKT